MSHSLGRQARPQNAAGLSGWAGGQGESSSVHSGGLFQFRGSLAGGAPGGRAPQLTEGQGAGSFVLRALPKRQKDRAEYLSHC